MTRWILSLGSPVWHLHKIRARRFFCGAAYTLQYVKSTRQTAPKQRCELCYANRPKTKRGKKLTSDLRNEVGKMFSPTVKKVAEDEPHWFTHAGKHEKRIPIRTMKDAHLINAIKYMQTNKKRLHEVCMEDGASMLATLRGEIASFATEEEISRLFKLTPERFLEEETVYPHLMKEAEKRGLAVVGLSSWFRRGTTSL